MTFSAKGATFPDRLFSIQTQGLFPEKEFSQSHISIDIRPRDNALKPLFFRASIDPKNRQKLNLFKDTKKRGIYGKNWQIL